MFGKLFSGFFEIILLIFAAILFELVVNSDERVENNEKARVEMNVGLIIFYCILGKYRKKKRIQNGFSILI